MESGRQVDGGINGAWDEYLMRMALADTIEGLVENGKTALLRACLRTYRDRRASAGRSGGASGFRQAPVVSIKPTARLPGLQQPEMRKRQVQLPAGTMFRSVLPLLRGVLPRLNGRL